MVMLIWNETVNLILVQTLNIIVLQFQNPAESHVALQLSLFFLLHAAKVRSSCEEGPGQSALQSAYHNPKLDVTELKQNRTP